MSSQFGLEESINERVNSQIYSDVISSYVDINSVTAQRNIVPGSYKESVVQCTDQTLATLNSAGGQTLFTRLKLTPQVRNATLAQLAQIYFQYIIPANSLGIILKKMTNNGSTESTADVSTVNFRNHGFSNDIQFKLFYDTGFSIASMVQLCLVADAKVSTENFNYQQSLLTLNSLPDFVTENSNCESTLKALVANPGFRGVGSGLINIDCDEAQNSADNYCHIIDHDISIEGVIDLDRGNPLFHNFPIITRNMGELYIRLYMENFLRELKVVYLDKVRNPAQVIANPGTSQATSPSFGPVYLPFQRIPIDKPDFIFIDGDTYKVKLVNLKQNAIVHTAVVPFKQTNPIYTLNNISWTRFEIRKVEFDIEDYEDIKASQAKAGTYKFPVHLWRSKNFDQTNAASSSSNALQTTLNAPNIDRLFITQPWSRDYYTHLPTVACTDINPQLHNNPVLPRTEDCLNSRTVERIGNVFVDTDKYSMPTDLFNSLNVPTIYKELQLKGLNTYGGLAAFEEIQRGFAYPSYQVILPNKFAYALELNEGGCFRRGFNSVIDGNYSPTVPVNLQQSTQTSANIYYDNGVAHGGSTFDTANQEGDIVNTNSGFNSVVSYGDLRVSGAVASIHCLCDYIFWVNFDQFGMMTDFGVSEYNDRA